MQCVRWLVIHTCNVKKANVSPSISTVILKLPNYTVVLAMPLCVTSMNHGHSISL